MKNLQLISHSFISGAIKTGSCCLEKEELMVSWLFKKVGKYNGWINYTLLKTETKDNDNTYSLAEMNVS